MLRNFKKRHQRGAKGVTLVEVMMVLGVMAFILGLVMMLAVLVSQNRKQSEMREEFLVVKDTLNQLCQNADPCIPDGSSYNEALIKSGLLPKKYYDSTNNLLMGPWGHHIDIQNFTRDSGDINTQDGMITALFTISQPDECFTMLKIIGEINPNSGYSDVSTVTMTCNMIQSMGSYTGQMTL